MLVPATKQAHRNGDRQDRRVAEAKDWRQETGLQDGHQGRTDRQHGTDGQVDVAGNDHENHPRGHYANRNGLYRNVENVAGGHKLAVRGNVKGQAQDRKGDDHPE